MAILKACLNGDRARADHPAVPVTPAELAEAAYGVTRAGADAVHVHPRGLDERESLLWADIEPAVIAIRARCPGVPVGVSTREEILPDLEQRLELLREWNAGPDFASVNWHEEGAERVADVLVERGIGIEAGLFTPTAARKFLEWSGPVVRVLVEAIPGVSPGADGIAAVQGVLAELPDGFDMLAHGENTWAWDVLAWAGAHGYSRRAGLEDMLTRPDGTPARDNADLIEQALAGPLDAR